MKKINTIPQYIEQRFFILFYRFYLFYRLSRFRALPAPTLQLSIFILN